LETQSNVQGKKKIEITSGSLEHDWLLLIEMSKMCCFQSLDQYNQQVVLNVTSYAITRGKYS
jgi:hypothetical protein